MSTDSAPQAEPAAQPLMRLDQVSLSRGGGAPMFAGVSFALAPGSLHLLTGPPGSGKSSLLRLMALVEAPSAGLVQVFGRDAATLRRSEARIVRRRIGAVLQPEVLLDHLSVWDNVALVPRGLGRRRKAYAAEVDAVLKWTGLAGSEAASPHALSTGERHRLAIARAVVAAPDILIIDEPAEGLDQEERRRAAKLAEALARNGSGCVIASREDDAFAAARPRLVLRAGRLSLTESPAP